MRKIAFALALLCGCMSNINPRETLADSVHQVNYAARWGRVDVAVERVAPSYRTTFLRSRRPWGRDLQIADVELVDIHLVDGDNARAQSIVAVSWYDLRAMDLRTTTLEQAWRRTGQAYVLESEEIVEGDESLVTPPAEEQSSSEDGDQS